MSQDDSRRMRFTLAPIVPCEPGDHQDQRGDSVVVQTRFEFLQTDPRRGRAPRIDKCAAHRTQIMGHPAMRQMRIAYSKPISEATPIRNAGSVIPVAKGRVR